MAKTNPSLAVPSVAVPTDLIARVRAATHMAHELRARRDALPAEMRRTRVAVDDARSALGAAETAHRAAIRSGGMAVVGDLDDLRAAIASAEAALAALEAEAAALPGKFAEVIEALAADAHELDKIFGKTSAEAGEFVRRRIDEVAREFRALVSIADEIGMRIFGNRGETNPINGLPITMNADDSLRDLAAALFEMRAVTRAADRVIE